MTAPSLNYFRYFASGPELKRWGLGLTAAGHTVVSPGSPYPPARHPSDHQFDWARGRAIDALQVIYISAGRGWFESDATGSRVVSAGMAFAVLPRTWHRYRPDPATGWTESWIEVQGVLPERLIREGTFSARGAVRRIHPGSGLEEALAAVHRDARTSGASFDAQLAARAFAVLAGWANAARSQPARSRITQAVLAAEQHFADHLTEPVNVEALAAKLGVAYSHFRRAFKAQTGLSPWQYVLHQRLSRARRQLAATDATIEAVAAQLGFSSAFHLSSTFKRVFGTAPEPWRRALAAESKTRR